MIDIDALIKRMNATGKGETICLNHDECEALLILLEEREERIDIMSEGKMKKVVYKINPWTNLPVAFCPNCNETVKMYGYGHGFAKHQKYCPYCGQEIDWNGGDLE